MVEYIEREAALKSLEFVTNDTTCPIHTAAYIDQIISQEPAADVVEVRHGEWKQVDAIFFDHEVLYFKCPLCNTTWESKTNYCPNCGAKMDRKGEGE